jgi:hypothetical protein
VAPRLALLLLVVYSVLVLIVLVNLLIAIVSDTFKEIKRSEELQMLKYQALMIGEVEAGLTEGQKEWLNLVNNKPFMHVLEPTPGVGTKLSSLKKLPRAQRKLKREQQAQELRLQVQQIAAEVRGGVGLRDDVRKSMANELRIEVVQLQALVQQQALAMQQLLAEFRQHHGAQV